MKTSEPHQPKAGGDRLLSIFWRKPADSLAERTRRRVTLHLIPYLFFLYILAYLDRVNVSVAQFGMARFINGLHDTPAYQFYFFRFMLGFFEGGFFPSVIVYLSHWFRYQDRAKAIAGFMAAIPLSSMLGVPASGLLLDVNWLNLPGWRWILILEGIAPVLAGFATIFFLPNGPTQAKWLPPEERDWLMAELEREHKAKQGHGHWAWVHHLGMVLLLTGVYFGLNFTSYGLSMFMPAIIRSQLHIRDDLASFLAALPYGMGFLGML